MKRTSAKKAPRHRHRRAHTNGQRRSPHISIKAGEVPLLPKVFDRNEVSSDGYATSVQATRLRNRATQRRRGGPNRQQQKEKLTEKSQQIQDAYLEHVGSLPAIKTADLGGGRIAVRSGPVTLLELGPVTPVEGRPGVTRRAVEGGALVPASEAGHGVLEARVSEDGDDLLVELRVADFRSALRGVRDRAPIRAGLYKATQLQIHRLVTRMFLKKLGTANGTAILSKMRR